MDMTYVLLGIYFINFFFALKLLLKFNYNFSNTYYVLIFCLLFPFFTPIVYLIATLDDYSRKILMKKQNSDLSNINDLNIPVIYENNQLQYFTNGKTLFNDIYQEIEKAKKFIHISFFVITSDSVGQEFCSQLIKKLKMGIEVVILYDKIGSYAFKKKTIKELIQHGAEVVPFTKVFLKSFYLNLNYRNHRKMIIIDNRVSYLGGFNIGDNYISKNRKLGVWYDLELKVFGDATSGIERRFLADYLYAIGSNKDITKYLIKSDFSGKSRLDLVSSGADVSIINEIEHRFLSYIYNAKDYLFIQTPYLVLSDAMIKALRYASHKGVEVAIMLPNKNDHPFALQATKAYARTLVTDNITVYLYDKDAFMHAKMFLVDDMVSIGTTNLDFRSFKYCFEYNAFIYDKDFASKMKEEFIKQTIYCTKFTKHDIESLSMFRRVTEDFCKLLSTLL